MSSDTPRDVFGRRNSHFFDFEANRPEDFLLITGARNGFIGSRQCVVCLRDTSHCQVQAEFLLAPIKSNLRMKNITWHAWQVSHSQLRVWRLETQCCSEQPRKAAMSALHQHRHTLWQNQINCHCLPLP